MGVRVQDPATQAPTALPPGILAAVFVPATEDDVELIASTGDVTSPILDLAPLLRALTAVTATAS